METLKVRSSASRIEPHPIYLKHGYVPGKAQHVYAKALQDT